jgi:phosphoenolpyruvate carboxykinase (GTP)
MRKFQQLFYISEVLKHSVETPIGWVPSKGAINISGLNVSDDTMNELFKINKSEFLSDMNKHREFLDQFGTKTPEYINKELENTINKLQN